MSLLVRVSGRGFVAGMVLEDDRVVRAAPILLRRFLGLSLDEAKAIGIPGAESSPATPGRRHHHAVQAVRPRRDGGAPGDPCRGDDAVIVVSTIGLGGGWIPDTTGRRTEHGDGVVVGPRLHGGDGRARRAPRPAVSPQAIEPPLCRPGARRQRRRRDRAAGRRPGAPFDGSPRGRRSRRQKRCRSPPRLVRLDAVMGAIASRRRRSRMHPLLPRQRIRKLRDGNLLLRASRRLTHCKRLGDWPDTKHGTRSS
jgi:hypothetical protein